MDPSSILMPSSLQNAAVFTIVLAFAGYLVTFMINRMMARRADRLRLVNQRLNEFYGPLYVATVAGNIAYNSLLKKQGKTECHPIRDEDLKEWTLWMTTIFMPLNNVREKIIIENAHLIVEEQMPQCLLDFVTHVVGYKALLSKWAEGDYTERRSMIGWPAEFDGYVERSYQGAQSRADAAAAQCVVAALEALGAAQKRLGVRVSHHLGVERRHPRHGLGQPRLVGPRAFLLRRRIDMFDRFDQVGTGQKERVSSHAVAGQQQHIALARQRVQRLQRHHVDAGAISGDELQAILGMKRTLSRPPRFLPRP